MRFPDDHKSPPPDDTWLQFLDDVVVAVALGAVIAAIVFGVATL